MCKKYLSIISLVASPFVLFHTNAQAETTTQVKCVNKEQFSFWLSHENNPGLLVSISGYWKTYLSSAAKFKYFVINGGTPMIDSIVNACRKLNPSYKYISAAEYKTNEVSLFAIDENTLYNGFMMYFHGKWMPSFFLTAIEWQERNMKIMYDLDLQENRYLTIQQVLESIAASKE